MLWTNEYFMEWDGHFRNSTFPTALQTSEASAKGPAKSNNVAHGWDDEANMHIICMHADVFGFKHKLCSKGTLKTQPSKRNI